MDVDADVVAVVVAAGVVGAGVRRARVRIAAAAAISIDNVLTVPAVASTVASARIKAKTYLIGGRLCT